MIDQTIKPAPCPFCGCDDVLVIQAQQDHAFVFCNGCPAHGPKKDEIGDWTRPIRAWNAAPRSTTE